MIRLFPEVATLEEFEPIAREEGLLRPGIDVIRGRLQLESKSIERFPTGSLPVYAIGEDLVLKVYPPFDHAAGQTEAAALRAVDGRLPVPTPRALRTGEIEGWSYLLMDRLRGENLASAWPRLGREERIRLAAGLGEALAALHSLRGPELRPLAIDWPAFLAGQHSTAVERQRRRGLDEHWLAQIPGFLEGVRLSSGSGSLLHTEVMREHLLYDPAGGRISGLFDFEPAMVGAPEYDFVAVGLFFSCGEPGILGRVLVSYGYPESGLDQDLESRLLAYTILHRYAHLPWYLERMPPPREGCSLQELAAHWWRLTA